MRIVVFSDSHGNHIKLAGLIENHLDDADIFIHLGDGQSEFKQIAGLYPHIKMLSVPGNSDWRGEGNAVETLDVEGRKILYTHGHIYRVKYGIEILEEAAVARNADIAMFGHTHIPLSSFDGKIYLFNPGSINQGAGSTKPSYGIVDITAEGIDPRIITL